MQFRPPLPGEKSPRGVRPVASSQGWHGTCALETGSLGGRRAVHATHWPALPSKECGSHSQPLRSAFGTSECGHQLHGACPGENFPAAQRSQPPLSRSQPKPALQLPGHAALSTQHSCSWPAAARSRASVQSAKLRIDRRAPVGHTVPSASASPS